MDCRGGGLCLLWKEEVELGVRHSSPNHIDTECRVEGSSTWWRFTSFYRFLNTAERHLSWMLMSMLSQQGSLPWLCGGRGISMRC